MKIFGLSVIVRMAVLKLVFWAWVKIYEFLQTCLPPESMAEIPPSPTQNPPTTTIATSTTDLIQNESNNPV